MPEGDSVFRAARTLNRALAGKPVVRFESVLPSLTRVHEDAPIIGRIVENVSSAGKHVLMRFSGDLVLRTHMKMNGSWHIYRPGERWRKPRRDMRVLIATIDFEAVGFNVPVAEFLRRADLERHVELRNLGPDLLADHVDTAEAIARLKARGAMEIADALLNQRVIAGIGNVYKSEVLFACGVNPFGHVSALSDDELVRLIETGVRFLRANMSDSMSPMTTYAGYRRTTRHSNPSERLWVYGRAQLPCRKCGTAISVRAQGPDARLTYWCSRCQQKR